MEKANRVLPRECNGHRKHPLPTTQKTLHMDHQMVNPEKRLIISFAAKDEEALYSQQKQYYASHDELLIAKFRHKLMQVGKMTRLLFDLGIT